MPEIVNRFNLAGKIILTYDHPSWMHDQSGGQSRDESDQKMEEYFVDQNIQDYDREGKYCFTIWENDSFKKYLRNLAFSQSYLIWACQKYPNESEYQFEKKNWTWAIFGYEGRLFYEIYSTLSEPKISEGEEEIEYPGFIQGSGGLDIEI